MGGGRHNERYTSCLSPLLQARAKIHTEQNGDQKQMLVSHGNELADDADRFFVILIPFIRKGKVSRSIYKELSHML